MCIYIYTDNHNIYCIYIYNLYIEYAKKTSALALVCGQPWVFDLRKKGMSPNLWKEHPNSPNPLILSDFPRWMNGHNLGLEYIQTYQGIFLPLSSICAPLGMKGNSCCCNKPWSNSTCPRLTPAVGISPPLTQICLSITASLWIMFPTSQADVQYFQTFFLLVCNNYPYTHV